MKQDVIEKIKSIIISAGVIADYHQNDNLDIELKSDDSPVTKVDKMVSAHIFEGLSTLTPKILVISEEGSDLDDYQNGLRDKTFWLVDPIDGTKSYIRGESTYTVNIGLIENGEPSFGFIYRPSLKLLHYTDENKILRVEKDGVDITSEITRDNKETRVAAVSSHSMSAEVKKFIEDDKVSEVIRIPSSIKLCLVADGSVDVYPRFGQTMEWDIAAGHAIIKATGGNIFDIEGNVMKYGKPKLLNLGFIARGKK
ncbi:MAG: 3'(2'),5'-bisphosphate nucleotidase CysQ [Rickettsiaceae bacterium]|nr:3'(2'),5'-bisphosphate nucleotidase CysQ [Rickettsiaceae bacterium]